MPLLPVLSARGCAGQEAAAPMRKCFLPGGAGAPTLTYGGCSCPTSCFGSPA